MVAGVVVVSVVVVVDIFVIDVLVEIISVSVDLICNSRLFPQDFLVIQPKK